MTQLIYEPSKTTHWKNLFPNKMMLLGSQNLNPGEELVAKISCVKVQKIKSQNGNEEEVAVIEFCNAPPMVLNVTNARTIASLYGELYQLWEGKSIQIYATNVKAFGIEQMALRVRSVIPDADYDISEYKVKLESCKTISDLREVFMQIPKHLKPRLSEKKDEMKELLSENN